MFKFTSFDNAATCRAVRGVCSAGFNTIVHPVARAGPHFQANIKIG